MMAESYLRQQWLMFGRLTVDLINSQRTRKDQISPIGLYPFFGPPPILKATEKDEIDLIKQLEGSTWLKITNKTTS